ncbi:MAG: CPBP family intramembrane metalloprotease [Clostridiales bacterium]|nr:CPBP family intramembrane metalloprotease [Clostridiales bacterium]
MENKKYKFRYYYGLIAFVVSVVLLIFVCGPLQLQFGMAGLAATEIILLLLAVGAALLTKKLTGTSLKEIFPIRVPNPRQILGSVLIYFGGYALMLSSAYLSMFFFPEAMEIATQLSDFTTTVPFPLAILITAVMPAICEEALHRGFIMASFRTLRDEPRLKGKETLARALVVGLCGIIFGLFHLDPTRLIPTAILGAVFAYMNIKTESILPSVIMHFTNNVFSVISMYAMSALQQAVPEEQLEAALEAAEAASSSSMFSDLRAVAGLALILTGVALPLLYGGIKMLNPKKRGFAGVYPTYPNYPTGNQTSPAGGGSPIYGENPPQGYVVTQDGDVLDASSGENAYAEQEPAAQKSSASPLAKAVAVGLTSLVLIVGGSVLIAMSDTMPAERPFSFEQRIDEETAVSETTFASE